MPSPPRGRSERAKRRAQQKSAPAPAEGRQRSAAKAITGGPPAACPEVNYTRALWLGLAVLLIATVVAFRPVVDADFISWDDRAYVTRNKLLPEVGGLLKIWNPRTTFEEQDYPLLFTSYWLEYRLWGTNSTGYHLTNLGLHLANVVLVLFLARELGAPPWVALGATGVFALHPTQVASVAWIAERKNVLSGLFYLIAFLLYLRHRRTGRVGLYAGCLGAFAAALLTKTQTITLPVSIFLADWLLQASGRLRRDGLLAIGRRVAPMLILALLASLITIHFEHRALPWRRLPTLGERPFIVANAPWFYIFKFALPLEVAPIYPRWNISPGDPKWWIGVFAWPVVLALVAAGRRRIGVLTQWGAAHFCVSLAPVVGLVPFGFQQYSFVADHFLYVAAVGGGLALAECADRVAGSPMWARRRTLMTIIGVMLLAAYGVQSYRESSHWRDPDTFWRHVIERNPGSFEAYFSLGNERRDGGHWDDALTLYRKAFEIRPDSPGAFSGYITALRKTEGVQAAIDACTAKLAQDPRFFQAYLERAAGYEMVGRQAEAIGDYERILRVEQKGSDEWKFAQRRRDRLRASVRQPQ